MQARPLNSDIAQGGIVATRGGGQHSTLRLLVGLVYLVP